MDFLTAQQLKRPREFLSFHLTCQLRISLIVNVNDCNFLLITLLEKLKVQSKSSPLIFYEESTNCYYRSSDQEL